MSPSARVASLRAAVREPAVRAGSPPRHLEPQVIVTTSEEERLRALGADGVAVRLGLQAIAHLLLAEPIRAGLRRPK
jgi:hypothetical protein